MVYNNAEFAYKQCDSLVDSCATYFAKTSLGMEEAMCNVALVC